MRYAIYAVLVVLGIGGVLLGVNAIVDPRTELQAILFILIGAVALSGLGVVMAIENATKGQLADLREIRRCAVQAEKRAQAIDAAVVAEK